MIFSESLDLSIMTLRLKIAFYAILASLTLFGNWSCKKAKSPVSIEGKYNGSMLQNGPVATFKDYRTGPLTFEVFEGGSNKISIQFASNQFVVDADVNKNDFTIIPKSIEYGGGIRYDISGNGKFKTDSMFILWTQKQYTILGPNNISLVGITEFKGTLKKL